ncbi:MAG: hypothetical protein PVH00_11395 [Gemmatimonadota bacterium]|jgi:hypothetical protein
MSIERRAAAVAAVALATFAACSGGGTEDVTLHDYSASLPSGWEPGTPTNEMRAAEYTVCLGGADTANVIVYWFEEGQGGDVQQNIDRWTSQFATPDGGAVAPTVSTLDGGAFPITLVELEGTYGRGMGMGPGRETPTAGQALDAAIVETPTGRFFVQLFGNAGCVAATRDAFLDYVKSIS